MDRFDYLNLISEIGAMEYRLTAPRPALSDDEYADAETKVRKALDNIDLCRLRAMEEKLVCFKL